MKRRGRDHGPAHSRVVVPRQYEDGTIYHEERATDWPVHLQHCPAGYVAVGLCRLEYDGAWDVDSSRRGLD